LIRCHDLTELKKYVDATNATGNGAITLKSEDVSMIETLETHMPASLRSRLKPDYISRSVCGERHKTDGDDDSDDDNDDVDNDDDGGNDGGNNDIDIDIDDSLDQNVSGDDDDEQESTPVRARDAKRKRRGSTSTFQYESSLYLPLLFDYPLQVELLQSERSQLYVMQWQIWHKHL
jgi:hypothetical protein